MGNQSAAPEREAERWPEARPGETPKERVDRELVELLGELRVALPGVQVLFAFLLIVPFTERFEELTGLQRDVYFAALLCAAASSVLLIAPSAYHRLRFRHPNKAQMVIDSNRLAIAGLGFLALAMTGVVLLISSVLFGTVTSVLTTALTFAVFGGAWYVLPLRRRL